MAQSAFKAFTPDPSSRQDLLLSPGDRVAVASEPAIPYEIVHISQQKAWVRSLRSGAQQIVAMGDICLIRPTLSAGLSLH